MSLRDQPYIPLYVNDFLTDEKLNRCSVAAWGVYIKLMCILHKSENYGSITLRDREKKSGKQIENFATILLPQIGCSFDDLVAALDELTYFGIIQIEGDTLSQKRMVKDGELSKIRAESGSKGGNQKKQNDSKKCSKRVAKGVANGKQNTEYENEYEYEYENKDIETYSFNKQASDLGDRLSVMAQRAIDSLEGKRENNKH